MSPQCLLFALLFQPAPADSPGTCCKMRTRTQFTTMQQAAFENVLYCMQAWLQRQPQRLTWSSSTRRTGCRRSCFHWSPRCRMPSSRRVLSPQCQSQRTRLHWYKHATAVSCYSRHHNGCAAGWLTRPWHKLTSDGSFTIFTRLMLPGIWTVRRRSASLLQPSAAQTPGCWPRGCQRHALPLALWN